MLYDLLKQYLRKFGEGFPMFQIARGLTEEETAKIVRRCLQEGKTAYDLKLCTVDEDVIY